MLFSIDFNALFYIPAKNNKKILKYTGFSARILEDFNFIYHNISVNKSALNRVYHIPNIPKGVFLYYPPLPAFRRHSH